MTRPTLERMDEGKGAMASVYGALTSWAKRTTTGFADWVSSTPPEEGEPSLPAKNELIYRLKQWPNLPHRLKTAGMYRALSVMSNRPVNRRWILAQSRVSAAQLDHLLQLWAAAGFVEVIDPSTFD